MLGAHAAFVGSTPTEVEIFIWIMSPLWSKKTSVAATDKRNNVILHRKIVNIEPIYGVYCSVWRRYICYLSILFGGCLDGVMVKDVRRCSARRARRIRGFAPHRSRNNYIMIMSPLWSKKTSVAATDKRNNIILHRKIVNIEPIYGVYCSVWRRYICYLSILFWGCLDGVMVKDVRRCSARRARRIRGFDPHRSRNIYMDYVSTVVEKDKCRCYR